MTKIKRQELEELYQAITRCENLPGEKFSYALLKNQKKLFPEIKKIYEYASKIRPEQTPKILSYVAKIDEIKSGKIVKNEEGIDLSFKDLESLYPEESAIVKTFDNKMKKYLYTDIEIDFYMISQKDVSSQITLAQRKGIDILLEDVK